jgi:DNA helicase-2/ATP-dependent DNA helicase PcrA
VAAVTAWLVARHEEGVPWRELAVLYRVHAQSPAYEAALAQAGVPFTVRGGEGFFDRPEVRQVISTLADRARREPAADALDACRAVLTATGWTEQAPTGQGRVRERWESLAAVLALAEELVAAGNADLAGLMTELSERAQAEHPLSADGITLSTLHGAKGLEWHSVALVGVQEGTLPLAQAAGPEQLQEEARLFYVGITRARRGLLITWSRFRNGGVRQPSRFLNGLTSSARSLGPRPARRSKPKTEMSARCRVCGGPLSTGAERKLSRHLSCAVDFDEALYQELTSWRSVVAAKRSLPAYCIFTDATLLAIAEQLPVDEQALLAIPGVGKAKLEAYSADLLKLIAERG